MNTQPPPEDPTGHDEPISPYAPPPRRAGLTRNTSMFVVLVVAAVALVAFLVILAIR